MSEDTPTENIGLPEDNRVKRRYTMSEAALEQRRNAAKQPKPGMENKRNNWRHGKYATSFLTRFKPCLSTCTDYPCQLVEDGKTEPGGDCLDAEELLHVIRAVHDAINDPKKADDFKEIAAVSIGNSLKILEMLQEDILRDGSIVKTIKYTKQGKRYEEYKLHPGLLALPKMIQDLGMHPDQFMITPKAQAQKNSEEQATKSILDMFKGVAGKFNDSEKE